MRIGVQIIIVSCAIIILVVGIGGALAVRLQERFFVELIRQQALDQSGTIRRGLATHMLQNKREDLKSIIETVARQEGINGIRLTNKEGRVVLASDPRAVGLKLDRASEGCIECHRPGAVPARELSAGGAARLVSSPQGRRFMVTEPIPNEKACHACHAPAQHVLGVLELDLSFDRFGRRLASARLLLLAFGAALAVLIALGQGVFTYFEITLPIHKLILATRRVAAGSLSFEPDVSARNELGELTSAFGEMTAKLRASKERIDNWTQELSARIAQATAELEQTNQKLRAANRLKSKFVRDVAHEIKAPLAAVANCLQVVLQGYAANPEKQREMLDRAERRVEFLTELVNALLDLAQSEEGASAKVLERVSLAAAAEKVVELLQGKAREGDVRLEFSAGPEPPQVAANSRDLEMLITNLVDNAVKYSRPGGRVAVSVSTEGLFGRLAVEDSGIGIPADGLRHLFQEFYRAANAREQHKTGTGLGLAIAKRLAEGYGGRIEVESVEGRGSTFTVFLPLETGTPQS